MRATEGLELESVRRIYWIPPMMMNMMVFGVIVLTQYSRYLTLSPETQSYRQSMFCLDTTFRQGPSSRRSNSVQGPPPIRKRILWYRRMSATGMSERGWSSM